MRSWTADTFLVRVTHLVHYYHIGTRSSRVRNYTIGPMTSARCPSCNYRDLMTLLIGSNDGGVYRHPGCCGGHITPDRSPPRSCSIINPSTHLEGNPCLTPLKLTLVDSQSRRVSIRQPRRTPQLGDYDRRYCRTDPTTR